MKNATLFLSVLLSLSTSWATPPTFFPGTFGNTSQYCGFKLYSSPIAENVIIKHINNPGLSNVFCTWNGHLETWKYDSVNNAYRVDRGEKFCLLTNGVQYDIKMTCYFSANSELESIDSYSPY